MPNLLRIHDQRHSGPGFSRIAQHACRSGLLTGLCRRSTTSIRRAYARQTIQNRRSAGSGFLGKCYLTEIVFDSREIEIDHFIPRVERADLKYAWTNLYAADHKANISRPKASGYLDPCNLDDDVEGQLLYALSMDDTPNFQARDRSCKSRKYCRVAEPIAFEKGGAG